MAASYMAAAARIYTGFENYTSLNNPGAGQTLNGVKNHESKEFLNPGDRSAFYTIIAFMPFVFLQLFRFLNIAAMSAITGFGTLLSTSIIIVSNIIAFLLVYLYGIKVSVKSGKFPGGILLVIAGFALLIFSFWPGVTQKVAYIAQAVAGNLASWWIIYILLKKVTRSASNTESPVLAIVKGKRPTAPLYWKNTSAIAISGILFFIFAFVYYGSYDMALPLKSWMIPAAVAVFTGFCAIAAVVTECVHLKKLIASNLRSISSPGKPETNSEISIEEQDSGNYNKNKSIGAKRCPAFYIPVFLLLATLIFPLTMLFPEKNAPEISAKKDYVRVMDYNIHQGFNIYGYLDLEGIARVIERSGADVVALQEVSRGWIVNGSADTYEWLADRLDMKYALFMPASDDIWGNAILSRYPLKLIDSGFLPRLDAPLRRSYLLAEIGLSGAVYGQDSGDYKINILCTHVHHIEGEPEIRLKQIQSVLGQWNGLQRTAIMGDFNASSDDPEIKPFYEAGLKDSQAELGKGDVLTWVHYEPFERIDYIWVTSDIEIIDTFIPYSTASDHLPVVLDIR
jgi:endonuclease/exonuclease/phosphatase family metal-dependent hydrolase